MSPDEVQEISLIEHLPEDLKTIPVPQLGGIITAVGLDECASLLLALPPERVPVVADQVFWEERSGQSTFQARGFLDLLQGLADFESRDVARLWVSFGEEYLAAILASVAKVELVSDRVRAHLALGEEGFQSFSVTNAFGDYSVDVVAEEWEEDLLALLRILEAEEPEFLDRTFYRCALVASETDESDERGSVVIGDLTEERISRRRAQGFLTPEDAMVLVRDFRNAASAFDMHQRLCAFRVRTRRPWRAAFHGTLVSSGEGMFSRYLDAVRVMSPHWGDDLLEDLGILSNLLACNYERSGFLPTPQEAPQLLRSLCELGLWDVSYVDAAFVVNTFHAGLRKVCDELALPLAHELDAVLRNRTLEFREIRRCWVDCVHERDLRAPSFVRWFAEGEFGIIHAVLGDLSMVLSSVVVQSLSLMLSPIPVLPGAFFSLPDRVVFPESQNQIEAALRFVRNLDRNIL